MAFREAIIQAMLCDFVRMQYPGTYFVSDSSGEHRATPQQRARAARLRKSRGYPDFFLAEMRGMYGGLYLELKAETAKLKKKNGDWVNEHVAEQAECHEQLRSKGYCVEFAIGLDEAMDMVRSYMRLRSNEELVKTCHPVFEEAF